MSDEMIRSVQDVREVDFDLDADSPIILILGAAYDSQEVIELNVGGHAARYRVVGYTTSFPPFTVNYRLREVRDP